MRVCWMRESGRGRLLWGRGEIVRVERGERRKDLILTFL